MVIDDLDVAIAEVEAAVADQQAEVLPDWMEEVGLDDKTWDIVQSIATMCTPAVARELKRVMS